MSGLRSQLREHATKSHAIIEHSCTCFLQSRLLCRRSIISPARRSNGNEYAWKNSDILDQVEADICTVAEQLLERELGCLDDDDRHVDLVSWLTLTLQHISDMHHHRQVHADSRFLIAVTRDSYVVTHVCVQQRMLLHWSSAKNAQLVASH